MENYISGEITFILTSIKKDSNGVISHIEFKLCGLSGVLSKKELIEFVNTLEDVASDDKNKSVDVKVNVNIQTCGGKKVTIVANKFLRTDGDKNHENDLLDLPNIS